MAQKARDAEERLADEQYRQEVLTYLGDQLAQFNDRDADGIQQILSQVIEALSEQLEGSVSTLFGGSIAKHTYVDGLSDVDALVVLKDGESAVTTPAQVKELLAGNLRDKYGDSAVSVGQLAVTVEVDDKCVQLLPAQRAGDTIRIASADGSGWSAISPQAFAEKLTRANQSLGGKLVPTIKLAKAIVAQLPEQRKMTGYHIESLAIQAFRNYEGERNVRGMLQHFFTASEKNVRAPITDSTGQSVHVDEYLGSANSVERRIRADACARIARRMLNADGARSMSQWKRLLGD